MVEKRIYAVSAFGKIHRQVFHLASMLFRPGGRKIIDPKSAPLKTLRQAGIIFQRSLSVPPGSSCTMTAVTFTS
jgi:hypothetical protein